MGWNRSHAASLELFQRRWAISLLGARALYIGAREYRIHGSNEPWTIGHAVSSGCIRLTNRDVIDLYDRVPVGTRVVVLLSTQPQSEDLVASNRSEYKPGSPVPKLRSSVEAPAARMLTKPIVVGAPPKPAIASNRPVADTTKSAIELPQEERPEQPASGVKASIRVATSGAPVAAAEVRATVQVKRPVSVLEGAVMTGVPAVAAEVKAAIETKTPPIVPKAALRKDEPADTAPVE